MKLATASLLSLALAFAAASPARAAPSLEEIKAVSPALADYTENLLNDEVWEREALSPRDRGLATLAALVARGQTTEMERQIVRALDNGVEPGEISELITHLAFYSGWGNAMAAVSVAAPVFQARDIEADQLAAIDPELLPLDEKAEKAREKNVEQSYGGVSPGVLHYTTEVLFRDLWLRPGLTPRDRSLVTVSALIAAGKVEQVPFHLNRAMDNGLTRDQASELLAHLAFYAGWPNIFSTLPVAQEVFRSRAD